MPCRLLEICPDSGPVSPVPSRNWPAAHGTPRASADNVALTPQGGRIYHSQSNTPEDARARAFGVAIIGIAIIAAGAILLGGNLGLIDSHYVFRNFGPVVLFFIGAVLLARRRHDQVLLGLVLMFVGAWGFATQQQWIRIHFWAVIG